MRRVFATLVVAFGLSAGGEDILQVYQLALENDTTFASAVISNRIQHLDNFSAHTQLLPSVSLNVPRGRSESRTRNTYPDEMLRDPRFGFLGVTPETNAKWDRRESSQIGWNASLRQTIFSVPQIINVITSRKSMQANEHQLFRSEQDLIIRVVGAYFDVLRARDSLENTIASEEAIQRQLEQAEQRFNVGLTASTDVLNAKASYDDAVVNRIQQVGNLDIVFEALKVLTGDPVSGLSRLAADFPIVNPVPESEEAWVEYAMRNNPQILSAEQNFENAKIRHFGQLTKDLPQISMGLSYNTSEAPFEFAGESTDYDVTRESVGLNVSLSFTAQFTSGSRFAADRRSALSREQQRLSLQQQRLNVENQTRRQYRTVRTDVLRVEARKRAIESSQASLEATQTGYEVGTRNIVEVLNAQRQLFNAQFSYESAKYDYIRAILQLKQNAGSLSAMELVELNEFMDNENVVTRVNSKSGT